MVWKGEPFRLVKKKPPTGAKRIGWRRYVIAQGMKIITGDCQGSHKAPEQPGLEWWADDDDECHLPKG